MTVHRAFSAPFLFLLAWTALSQPAAVSAESVAVRYVEGLSRGFLVVRTQDGQMIAEGDLSQAAHGDRVTSRMTFRFKDRSVEDETTIFSERGTFRLVRDHVLQKGPAFKHPMETSIDAMTGQVVVHYTDDVHLVITPQGEESFSTGISKHKAIDYDVKVEIGGAAGLVARLLGKQPPDTHVWVLLGEAPTSVGLEGPFYEGGPYLAC